MKTIFFTPGPTQLYPTVKNHIKKALGQNIPSLSHRGDKFMNIYKTTTESLKQLLDIPHSYQIFFLSSSLEAMERIIENTVKKYSFHLVNGAFSKKFFQTAQQLKKIPEKIEVALGRGFDMKKITVPARSELVCLTHNETSSGVSLPLSDINKLKSRFPNHLYALDIVSSAPYPKINFANFDLAFFSVQKGFGLPAGLAVLIVSPKALKKGVNSTSYHSFISLSEKAKIYQTPETPNVLNIYLLGKVAQDMLKKGIKKIRKETEEKAKLIYDFFETDKRFGPFIQEKRFRSLTTIAINVKDSQKILKHLSQAGIIVGKGYGEFKTKQIRIANFPSHQIEDVKKLLATIG